MKEKLLAMLAQHSGQNFDRVHKDSDRDYYMSAIEAKEYGLIDEVVTVHKAAADESKDKTTR